jgi:ferrochelatase
VKRAIVLFNLGGPDGSEAVEPFLCNLFSDPAVISLPTFLRRPLARFVAHRRAPKTRRIYAQIGGRSPILPKTEAQAAALTAELGEGTNVFVVMRYWHPFADETAVRVKQYAPDGIVLLPLYPQYSTTTTASSFAAWNRAAAAVGLTAPTAEVCCYPVSEGWIAALTDLTQKTLAAAKPGLSYRLLLSAHGLPERVINRGDPYRRQVEETAAALAARLNATDWRVCYQSRVGPLKWIGPATADEIRRAGAEGLGVAVVPISFVSEHSETLVELDRDYAELARAAGAKDYLRVPAAGTHPAFIRGLADLVRKCGERDVSSAADGRYCPAAVKRCGCLSV